MTDTNVIKSTHTPNSLRSVPARTILNGVSSVNNMQLAAMPFHYYFNIAINGINYHFNSPEESVFYSDNENAIIYFQDEPLSKFGWLTFKNRTPYEAGKLELLDPEKETFLILYEAPEAIYPVTVTEYSTTGKFISGHYSGIYTDAENNPAYHLSCSFRVKRHC